jgi:sugar phosphate isomerase/epimerase
LGEGQLELDAIVAALKQIGFAGTLTNDLYNYPLLDRGARHNAERIREVEIELGLAAPPRRARVE